jgi:type III secretory pathway component EscV
MKEDTVIFVAPDQDNFEKHKGKVLNNWIKEYMGVHEQKQNFDAVAEKYEEIFTDVEQRINQLALNVTPDKVEPLLEELVVKVSEKNKGEVKNKLS